MSDAKSTEALIQLFTDEYFEKLYYFCLKKASNGNEAQDLTADIAMSIICELRRGVTPVNFSAWVWQIARNNYAKWADKKHKRTMMFSGNDMDTLEIADDSNIANGFIHREDIKLLRRELAFMSSDYRDIIIAYYIDYRKIQDIADSLHLPVGTVKSKLFRSRTILKEGMEMAREFGTLSYKPENIDFTINGKSGNNGEPWAVINKKLYKNLLLAAYRTPSTAEELAIEIGMALPYLEDELDILEKGEFLRKNGKKYETNFFIVSANAQEQIYTHLHAIMPLLTEKIIALLENRVKAYEENGYSWHEGYQPYEDMKWAMLMLTIDEVSRGVLSDINHKQTAHTKASLGRYGHTLRPNGGEWDLLGMEDYTGDKPDYVGLHGANKGLSESDVFINFGQFKYKYNGIENKTPFDLNYGHAKALVAAANHNTNDIPQQILNELVGYGYLTKTDSQYTPTFRVTFTNKIGGMNAEQTANHERLYAEAYAIALEHYNFCREVIYREIPDFFKNDQYQIEYACANILQMRGAVLQGALANGYITYAEGDDRKMLGAYLII